MSGKDRTGLKSSNVMNIKTKRAREEEQDVSDKPRSPAQISKRAKTGHDVSGTSLIEDVENQPPNKSKNAASQKETSKKLKQTKLDFGRSSGVNPIKTKLLAKKGRKIAVAEAVRQYHLSLSQIDSLRAPNQSNSGVNQYERDYWFEERDVEYLALEMYGGKDGFVELLEDKRDAYCYSDQCSRGDSRAGKKNSGRKTQAAQGPDGSPESDWHFRVQVVL
ncbi:hypothetical protein CPB83DRAFT_858221 [Crepidotus variabilis]|uniref:Uncharacterized protein n=1 Tax=Crepidotus variabilis TaxID=179855 RepID=A0A9P6EBZ7_9AGAR|nr:hypothetical protein CPB83DRAFT_858221 [Crepidotus variabilis]